MAYIFPARKPNQNPSRRMIALAALFLLVIVSVWQFAGLHQFFSKIVLNAAAPFLRGGKIVSDRIDLFSSWMRSQETLHNENERLRQELARLEVQNILYNSIFEENQKLKEILNRGAGNEKRVLAAVLAKPPRSPYDTFIIDIGVGSHITPGDIVLAFGDIVVGTIDIVAEQSARVKLFSSPGVKNDVLVGKENIHAIALGIGGGNFETKLPRGVDVEEGEAILFPAIYKEIVGVVEVIEAEPADSFQRILFKSPVNIFELQWVEVIISD